MLSGLGGKGCSERVHSVDGGEVGLHSLQLYVCGICAAQGDRINRPNLPTCKAKADGLGLRLRNQDYLHILNASQVAL